MIVLITMIMKMMIKIIIARINIGINTIVKIIIQIPMSGNIVRTENIRNRKTTKMKKENKLFCYLFLLRK